MGKAKIPSTPAIRQLRQAGVDFKPHFYRYEEHGGTKVAAEALGVDEHNVIKTLVLEDQNKQPLIMLMHGDREVSVKKLARAIDAKSIGPCDPVTAQKHTGYMVGGTSPFGTKKQLPVYCEKTVLKLEILFINGGNRGLLVEITPVDLQSVIDVTTVDAAQDSFD